MAMIVAAGFLRFEGRTSCHRCDRFDGTQAELLMFTALLIAS
jgi:hypothetical protein